MTTEAPQVRTVRLLGVPILQATTVEALLLIEQFMQDAPPALVAFANAHTLNLASSDASYRKVLQQATAVLNDGTGLALAARLHGKRFPENLNGTDFTPALLHLSAERGWRVFLLGAAPGVAEDAAQRLQRSVPGLTIAGWHHGFFGRAEDDQISIAIRAAAADVVLVGMGNPLQEQWLAANLPATGARLGLAVGAFLDFTAQRVPRAPVWMRSLGIEWIWRLAHEPRRLWRRYVVGNPIFLWRAARDRIAPL